MKVKAQENKLNKNYKKSTFILLGVLLLIIAVGVVQLTLSKQPDSTSPSIDFAKSVCTQIRGTPAWMQDGKIIGYGEGFPENNVQQSFNDVVNDYLIPNKIAMVWDPKCIHCQREIQRFGDSWQDYQDSGFTIECDLIK